jgi:hypothetical protein
LDRVIHNAHRIELKGVNRRPSLTLDQHPILTPRG